MLTTKLKLKKRVSTFITDGGEKRTSDDDILTPVKMLKKILNSLCINYVLIYMNGILVVLWKQFHFINC